MVLLTGFLSGSVLARTIEDEAARYRVRIDIGDAYISGVCMMQATDRYVLSALVNEFGVSLLTYRYDSQNGKVKILRITKVLDKYPIKQGLRADLAIAMAALQNQPPGKAYAYRSTKSDRAYNFIPIE